MEKRELQAGDVVQLAPGEHAFTGCFMLVTEPKSFGAEGFVAMPKRVGEPPGEAYYRAEWADMEYVGPAAWVSQAGETDERRHDEG